MAAAETDHDHVEVGRLRDVVALDDLQPATMISTRQLIGAIAAALGVLAMMFLLVLAAAPESDMARGARWWVLLFIYASGTLGAILMPPILILFWFTPSHFRRCRALLEEWRDAPVHTVGDAAQDAVLEAWICGVAAGGEKRVLRAHVRSVREAHRTARQHGLQPQRVFQIAAQARQRSFSTTATGTTGKGEATLQYPPVGHAWALSLAKTPRQRDPMLRTLNRGLFALSVAFGLMLLEHLLALVGVDADWFNYLIWPMFLLGWAVLARVTPEPHTSGAGPITALGLMITFYTIGYMTDDESNLGCAWGALTYLSALIFILVAIRYLSSVGNVVGEPWHTVDLLVIGILLLIPESVLALLAIRNQYNEIASDESGGLLPLLRWFRNDFDVYSCGTWLIGTARIGLILFALQRWAWATQRQIGQSTAGASPP